MGGGRKPLGQTDITNPNWDPNAKDFAGNWGFSTMKNGKRSPFTKDDVYQLSSGEWVPLGGNQDTQDKISKDKLVREKLAQDQKTELDHKVSAQSDMALKQVAKKKGKAKGGTILTSPLGALGSVGGSDSAARSKTLLGA